MKYMLALAAVMLTAAVVEAGPILRGLRNARQPDVVIVNNAAPVISYRAQSLSFRVPGYYGVPQQNFFVPQRFYSAPRGPQLLFLNGRWVLVD